MKPHLKHVTLICVDCFNYGSAISAIQKSMEQCNFAAVKFLTDRDIQVPGIETVRIPTITSKLEYSKFMINKLDEYVNTTFCLVIQHDGYVLDGSAWDDDFMKYDYIGASWLYTDGRNVGNGGFSLRSKNLLTALANDAHIQCNNNEDDVICREYRGHLERRHFITFAPEEVADRFAFELREPAQKTFGFHGYFHEPYKPVVVLKRSMAMGDIIAMEPLIAELFNQGYRVYLDVPETYFQLFRSYPLPVKHVSQLDGRIEAQFVNLDMSYEVMPYKNHVQAYFEVCFGHENGKKFTPKNPILYPKVTPDTKLFRKYVVLNVDHRETPHRNVFGVNWKQVVSQLRIWGYDVIQVGHYAEPTGAIKMNCPSTSMLQLVIAGADGFIGVDSGPANIAVAHGVPAVILFGSVNPHLIYPEIKPNMECITQLCPIGKDGCWHERPGTSGQTCEVDEIVPPCCIHDAAEIIEAFLKVSQNNKQP